MIIGIDLGTTNSAVGVFQNGEAVLIRNSLGHYLTPSAVSLNQDGSLLVGLPALERVGLKGMHTATAFKRWMGTDKLIPLGKHQFRAEELSAMVLKSLKAEAEAYLGEPVTEAVITVPAYFNQAQRKATQAAGELAGLKVERLLNEPTAAGLAYGLQERQDHSTFLVFDLGGGTFDVSVLEYFEGVVEVRASAGDTQLGGEDFVQCLIKLFLSRCPDLSDNDKDKLLGSKALWRAAEQTKRSLSDAEEAVMAYSDGSTHLSHTITRADFEKAADELLQRLRRPIQRALMDAKIDATALNEIVLVGGATRMPVVRQMASRLFQRLPLRTINPDEAIAQGAAVQAGLKARDAALNEIILTDVMPYSMGIITGQYINNQRYADRFSPIIERNMPVPISRMGNFSTLSDLQTKIELDIRQGESPIGTENLNLGNISFQVPPLPAGHANIEVRFTYDVNGILEVDVHCPQSGVRTNKVLQVTKNTMSPEDISAALEKLKRLKHHPREAQENIYLLERAKRLYEDHLGPHRQQIQVWLTQFESALDSQDEHLIRKARTEFRTALDSIDLGFIL